MLKNLLILYLVFIFVFKTNARRVTIQATDIECERLSWWPWSPGRYNIDSDDDGNAYLLSKNDGNHQKWELIPDNGYYQLKNIATDLYLDSNHEGSIYTHPANGGNFQKWQMNHYSNGAYWLRNVATGRQLDCHQKK